MPPDCPQPVALPALLRAARNTYAAAIRAALAATGFDDIPRNGIYVLGSIARNGAPLGQIIKDLRVSKQSAGQLVDTLVLRGYLERTINPEDRRRLSLSLSDHGRAAAEVSRAVVDGIEAELLSRVGPENIAATRLTLHTLIGMGRDEEEK